ncbi:MULTISPECIES: capsular polysaccharide export protein, LipB/KpsS family [Roseomonadaceae]|uniref:Capsular biosynthesis protein n=1 Tax=Falsiroseomonas oleicola TaxID=2801474 RepID=A0ABS6H1Q6_9PROT|nr:capsular biosynthesis protein [Roseomonas oleicola]MBU8542597.1 capsular biosynthesis protein [Roseomonas oleicola]
MQAAEPADARAADAQGMGAPGAAALRYSPGPFRPPRLAGREVPVLLVVGQGPDPLASALANPPARPDLAQARAVMAALLAMRPGALGTAMDAKGARAILLDPCDPARQATAIAQLVQHRAAGTPPLLLRDPFGPGEAVLPGSLPAPDPWALLDLGLPLHGASLPLGLLALAAGVPLADGRLAGADPALSWAALLAATRAADPFHNRPCPIPQALDLLALWQARATESRGIAACLGVHPYKRDRLRELLASDAPPPAFAATPARAITIARERGGAVLAWAASAPPDLPARCAEAGVPLRWLEDGFIRSAGLGAAFRAGASFALDQGGPYYDPQVESDLARLLAEAPFPPDLLERARSLRRAVVNRGVTKYNLPGAMPEITAPAGRRRILVPGQVEGDASIRQGAGDIRRNLDLLRAVRAAAPEAWLIYKPHPDIEAGFRRGRIAAADLDGLADQVLRHAPMAPLLGLVDEVHTITSLTGFEALLRGREVTCWGTPFYAGWGLTRDRGPDAAPPRSRRLTLDELVAGALILYPRCIDPLTRLPCPPEVLLDRMDRPDLFPPGRRARLRAAQGFVTRAVAWIRGWR